MDGMITDIERFALNDGPGIRTTVFFKGCNMVCPWCHNPETIRASRDLLYYKSKCIRCYKCVYACPSKAHKRIDGEHRFFPNLCVRCGKCAEICYAGAMVMSGRKTACEEVMAEIVQDKPYYTNSGGGVTLSGGEVLCQKDFAKEIAGACHAEGIAVGIETNLNFPWEEIKDTVCGMDLVMCDLKLIDDEAHKGQTGVSNRYIMDNIRHIGAGSIPFIVRTPLIPGVTDTEDNIRRIAAFVKECNTGGALLYYELLNFNPLGATKYESLKMENAFADARPLSEERMRALAEAAREAGIPVRAEA